MTSQLRHGKNITMKTSHFNPHQNATPRARNIISHANNIQMFVFYSSFVELKSNLLYEQVNDELKFQFISLTVAKVTLPLLQA